MSRAQDVAATRNRRSIRLRHFDYASHGAYFITIVTRERRQLFGRVVADVVQLSWAGQIVAEEWRRSGEIRANLVLDEFVVMPNHLHGIVFLLQPDEGVLRNAPTRSFGSSMAGELPVVVRNFKGAVTRRLRERGVAPVWQRNYFERVIRNERELRAIQQYVIDNPRRWAIDKENPEAFMPRRRGIP